MKFSESVKGFRGEWKSIYNERFGRPSTMYKMS